MKLVHGDLSGEIVNEQKECVEWIIESPELFSKYVGELYKQANKDEGEFVLSENNKEIDIAKYSEIVINPLSVEINNRKILYKIIYVFLTIFLYLLKCPQSLILSALRAFCFCGKPHISRSIFLYFLYQTWLKSW